MEISEFRALLSPLGQQALRDAVALLPQETDYLSHFTSLNRIYPAQITRPALETAILRREAIRKFPFASQMYFTRQALEQASSYEVSTYRSQRYAGYQLLVDLGCSIGGDSLALAHSAPVLGVDLDMLRLEMARANLQSICPDARIKYLQADLEAPLPLKNTSGLAIFFDPSRRDEEKRIHSVHHYHPPLAVVHNWLKKTPAIGVKISPGVALSELAGYAAELEFISLRGDLKEAVLWFGDLKSSTRRATLLPGPHSLSIDEKDDIPKLALHEPLAYLYEPDPAILRAGLVGLLGAQIGAYQLDPDIAYLTHDRQVETPFASAYPIEDWLPFSLKQLRLALRQKGIERVVIKKRGSPITPQALIHDLHLKEGSGGSPEERIVFLTHLRGKPIALICLPPG